MTQEKSPLSFLMQGLFGFLSGQPRRGAPAVRDCTQQAKAAVRWPRIFIAWLCLACAASCSNESGEPTQVHAKKRMELVRNEPVAAVEEQEETQEAAIPAKAEPEAPKKAGKKHDKTHNQKSDAESNAIFAGTNVLRIQIQISSKDLDILRETRRFGWGGNDEKRPVVRAKVVEGAQVYTNVALHLKGAAGSFREVDDNPCFTLNFQKFAPGQTFHGLHKLSLNNSVQDPSFLTEKICRELFEAAGVPVPRAGHAKVSLNRTDLGLRVLVEGFSKQFLKRYFKNTKGNLYDGGFLRDINQPLEVNSGDNPRDRSGLQALLNACGEPDPAKRFARLEKALDMDRFISFVAMDVIQCDWDGYAANRNNWRIFHDLDSNKMVFFPHGLDQMFGIERATPNYPIFPPMQGRVAAVVLRTPEGRRRYIARMNELYTNVFHVDALIKRVDELTAVIRPVIAQSNPQLANYHDYAIQNLKARITQRDKSLKRQLAAVASGAKIEESDDDSGLRFFPRRFRPVQQ
jgi:spore coat protein H